MKGERWRELLGGLGGVFAVKIGVGISVGAGIGAGTGGGMIAVNGV